MRRLFKDEYYIIVTDRISYLRQERNPLIVDDGDLLKYDELVQAVKKRGYVNYINSKRHKGLKDWIWRKTSVLDEFYNIATRVFWILNGMKDFPKCPTCGNRFGMGKNVALSQPYFDHCCSKCSNSDPDVIGRIGDSVFEKYGVRTYTQTLEYKVKAKTAYRNRYGADHNMKCEKGRQELRDAYKAKTGYEHNWQNPDCRRKCVETAKLRHGEDYTNRALARKTSIDRFGKPYYFQTGEFTEKSKCTSRMRWGTDFPAQSKAIKSKIEQSNLEHFGVPYSMMDPKVKTKRTATYRRKYGVDNPMQCPEIRRKAQKRYIYDGIHFDSGPEIAFYIWLKNNDIDFEYQPDAGFEYEFEGKIRRYFPDFRVGDRYYEIKGSHMLSESGVWICPWDRSQDGRYQAKQKCAEKSGVIILTSEDYTKYLEYVDEKYGKGWLDQFKAVDITPDAI